MGYGYGHLRVRSRVPSESNTKMSEILGDIPNGKSLTLYDYPTAAPFLGLTWLWIEYLPSPLDISTGTLV